MNLKILKLILALSLVVAIFGCSTKSAFNQAEHNANVKARSERSAEKGMQELDRQ